MINFAQITKAVETILRDKTSGYTIERNAKRNIDPNEAARGKGTIGIYRRGQNNDSHTTGTRPWLTQVEIEILITVIGRHGDDAEDTLQEREDEITTLFFAPVSGNLKLGGTVDIITGFEVNYEYDNDKQIWWHSASIILRAEVRA